MRETVICETDRCRSWACPSCGRKLSKAFGLRLRQRMFKRRCIMLTFTINPARFKGPADAYETVKRLKSIPKTMEAFCVEAGIPSRGQWIAKMELQRNGFPHWHVLLEVPESFRGKKGAADKHWKHGFSNVNFRGGVSYVAKAVSYIAKAMLPHQIAMTLDCSGLPAKGVRWVTTSHGFWQEPPKPQTEGEWQGEPPVDCKQGTIGDRVRVCGKHTRVTVYQNELSATVRVPVNSIAMEDFCNARHGGYRGSRNGGVILTATRGTVAFITELLGVPWLSEKCRDERMRYDKLPRHVFQLG